MAESQNQTWDRYHQAEYRQNQRGREEEMLAVLRSIAISVDLILERLAKKDDDARSA